MSEHPDFLVLGSGVAGLTFALVAARHGRVLSVTDLGFATKGGSLFMSYQQQKEALAALNRGGSLSNFGIGGIP